MQSNAPDMFCPQKFIQLTKKSCLTFHISYDIIRNSGEDEEK